MNKDDGPMTMSLPAAPKPEAITAIIDTREQRPLDLAPLQTITETLSTGDYSVHGLENVIAVERKGLSDLLSCVGVDRDRFEREVQRLMAYPVRALVVESSWQELEVGGWRSKVKPASVVGSLLGWSAMGLPIVMATNHERAGRYVSRMLYIAARRRWREARSLVIGTTGDSP
jgi:DNA excision repair protein ERCC-4